MLDQLEPQQHRRIGYRRGIKEGKRCDASTDGLLGRELRPELFGEVMNERVEFAEELDADLAQRRASVVPQGDPVTNRVRLG